MYNIIAGDSTVVMDLDPKRITGAKGLGIYRLNIEFSYLVRARQDKKYTIRNGSLEVNIKDKEQVIHYLGTARPKEPMYFETPDKNGQNGRLTFTLDLSPHQIELIEEKRNGEELFFETKLLCEVGGHDLSNDNRFYHGTNSTFRFPVNQSEWLKALQQMGYGKYLLFEIPIPDSKSDIPDKILNHLAAAREHFAKGHYDIAISKCRFVHDLLNDFLEDGEDIEQALKNFSNDKTTMSKEERMLFLRNSIRHYTHLAHHPDEDEEGNEVSFTRREAGTILGQTAALVSFYLK